MKGFIEVTVRENENKVLLPISKIKLIEYDGNFVFIATDTFVTKKKNYRSGYYTKESYLEVLAKIKEAAE